MRKVQGFPKSGRKGASEEVHGMFSRFAKIRERREGGFTLIELLVVILIIAILAAIAIPVFLNQRKKGWVSQMESALKNAATAQESYLTANPTYADTVLQLETEGWKYATTIVVTDALVTINGANAWCVQVSHTENVGSEEPMAISSEHTTPDPGTCAAAGVWTAP